MWSVLPKSDNNYFSANRCTLAAGAFFCRFFLLLF